MFRRVARGALAKEHTMSLPSDAGDVIPAKSAGKKLTGKVAVVTGASKGIGASIAKELASQGAAVVVNYASSKEGAERVVAEIEKAGGEARAVGGNVARPDEITKLFDETKKAYGKVDILVNNAGLYRFAPLEDITVESIAAMFDVNVTGLLLATKAAMPMFPPEGGSVINIGSVAGDEAPVMAAVYSGTKGAVNSITRVLAKELGPKRVRVNAVNPGPVETEGFDTSGVAESSWAKQMVHDTPLGRLGHPDDIASVAAFLASDEARWITGSLIEAAGGYR
jgi:3-oxoacyl-[acyl-carrier protein] reductase